MFALATRRGFAALVAFALGTTSTVAGGGSAPPVLDPALGRPHLVSMANDGRLLTSGIWGQTPEQVREVVHGPGAGLQGPAPSSLVLYAHGGVTGEAGGLFHIARLRRLFGEDPVHPVVFVWRTDVVSTLRNMVMDLFRRVTPEEPEGVQPANFVRELLDRLLERAARKYGFGEIWSEMKENARLASVLPDGGSRLVAEGLAEVVAARPSTKVHLVGHSAGSILLAHMLDRLAEGSNPVRVETVTLLAPACTVQLFREKYLPALRDGRIGKLKVFALDDTHERMDSVRGVYAKSILYLVSNAFEAEPGTPLLGMQTTFMFDPELKALVDDGTIELVITPNDLPSGSEEASRADDHAVFGAEPVTGQAVRAVILGASGQLSD